ncbi:MAG: hypothetical protein ACRDIV_17610 [Ktedonobacteraceae bacterium]
MRRTLFPAKTLTKILHHLGRQEDFEAEITLSIITQDAKNCWDEDEVRMGILLQYSDPDDGSAREVFNGLNDSMYDPIRWTRAIWVLEALPVINLTLFNCDLFWGIGHESSTTFQRVAAKVRQAVGDQAYREIMARPIPMEVIELLIHMADAGHKVDSAIYHVTDEIDAGTIRWSQELKRIGVVHPDYRRAYVAARAEIVSRYEPYLFAYATYREAPYSRESEGKCMIMLAIESIITDCIERGIEQDYGADIAALLSILKAEIETDDVLEDLEALENRCAKRDRDDTRDREPFTRPRPEERFQQTIPWFLQSFAEEPLSKQPVQRSRDDYQSILERLFQCWKELPVIHPLVS